MYHYTTSQMSSDTSTSDTATSENDIQQSTVQQSTVQEKTHQTDDVSIYDKKRIGFAPKLAGLSLISGMTVHNSKTKQTTDKTNDKPTVKTTGKTTVKTTGKTTDKSYTRTYVKSQKLKTPYDAYKDNMVKFGDYQGMPSIAARCTAIENGPIQFDAGHVPREVGMSKKILLITHFHTDHGSDVMNCVGYSDYRDHSEFLTIFCPAYCATDLFTKIRCDMSMQKGRPYDDAEIAKMVRIIGCKRDNGEFLTQDKIMSQKIPDLMIAQLIKMGDKHRVQTEGRNEVFIEPFACYHTVDTCGYVVHEIRKRLADHIILVEGSEINVNFTEDQLIQKKSKNEKKVNKEQADQVDISGSIEQILPYIWESDPKYADVIDFSKRHNVKIDVDIVDNIVNPKYTLKVRRLRFPEGLNISTKSVESCECILIPADFIFFKKYKIDIHTDYLIPKTMFFGDTGSYVFNDQTPGHKRLTELLSTVETVIIESTYLEYRHEMNDIQFKSRAENRHMFLFELEEQFKTYSQTKFLLIHFSACYDKAQIMHYVSKYNEKYKNVNAFI